MGRRRAGAPLDRHVEYYAADGTPYQWSDLFEYPKDDPARPGEASLVPRLKLGAKQDFSGYPQYSQHLPGLRKWLSRRCSIWCAYVGSRRRCSATLATFAMALALRELFRAISSDRGVVNAATIIVVLGSPLWHYGRMFTEPWLEAGASRRWPWCSVARPIFSRVLASRWACR